MKKIIGTFIAVLISQIALSQDYLSEFEKYYKTKDTINQLKVLTKWRSEKPNDPELYTNYFNYHFIQSRKEVLRMSKEKRKGEGFILKDSLNQTAGFLGSEIHYNQTALKKGFQIIEQGIELYPNRLDMRFGKIYALGEIFDWENFTLEIVKTVQHSSTNNNRWTWTNNTAYAGTKKEFLLDIQTYQLQLYNTGTDRLLKNMREIANEILKHYPNHVESLSNISITYIITGELDKGIKSLLKAEKIAPKDYIILANIANGYKLKGEKAKAIKYYEKTIKHGDERTKEFAKQQILKLKKH
jgi:tetratricopeptide (TPR) repeat protein